MAEVNLRSWPEILQASEGLQLNSTAVTLQHIVAWMARLESRLEELEQRAVTPIPPSRPEPDPPDGPLLYAVAQPPYQPSVRYQHEIYPLHQNPPTGYTYNAVTDPYMLSATTFQQLYAVQHTQQYLQLPSSYQPPPDTGCLPCGLSQPNRQDPISVWFPPQQPKVSTPTCWDATDCRVSSLLPPAQQLTDWQQLHQLGMPLLEDPTPNMHEREIQVLVDENKAPSETTKDEHRLEHEELVFEKDVYLCAFVGDVVEHALPKGLKANSFDGKIDSNISDDTNKQSKKAKEFFSTMDVLKILHQLCARLKQMHNFDPGGDTSPKLLLATFFVLSWFPP